MLSAFVVPSSASTSAIAAGRRRGEQRAQVVRHDAGHVGVDDERSRPASSPASAAGDRRALPAARIVDDLGAGLAARARPPSASAVTTRAAPTRERRGEHVAEHRERELAPRAARGVQARLALDARQTE